MHEHLIQTVFAKLVANYDCSNVKFFFSFLLLALFLEKKKIHISALVEETVTIVMCLSNAFIQLSMYTFKSISHLGKRMKRKKKITFLAPKN